jgi:hypothetical protein
MFSGREPVATVSGVTEPDPVERARQALFEATPVLVETLLRIVRETHNEKRRKSALRELRRVPKHPAWDTLSADQKAEVEAALRGAA